MESEMLLQITRPCDPTEPSCILANFFLRPSNCDNHPGDARCTKLKLPKAPINTIVKTDTTTIKYTIAEDLKTENPGKVSGLLCLPFSSDPRCRGQELTPRQPESLETSTPAVFGTVFSLSLWGIYCTLSEEGFRVLGEKVKGISQSSHSYKSTEF